MAGIVGDVTILSALVRAGPRLSSEAIWAIASGRRRSLAADARRVSALLDPPPRVEGLHLVPARDPFVLVSNHFQAPGMWIGWVAAAITSAVAEAREAEGRELHWLVTSEWRWFAVGERWVPNPITSLVFPRACRVWGLVPTPARPADVSGRARALRQILAHLGARGARTAAPEPVAIFPEGMATLALAEAKPGTGAFLQRINSRGVPLLPVGACREDGVLVLRFGPPFFLGEPPLGAQEDPDIWARQQVMVAIGRLLPRELWGTYADALARAQ